MSLFKNKISKSRYSVLFAFIAIFIIISTCIRTGLLFMSISSFDIKLLGLLKIFLLGFLFDLTVALLFVSVYNIYLLILPHKWLNSLFNKIVTYGGSFLIFFIIVFSFFAEITFWQEFESRFNFIAVDYLIYTYEVVKNIKESYPLPFLLSIVLIIPLSVLWLLIKKRIYYHAFHSDIPFKSRLLTTGLLAFVTIGLVMALKNSDAETSKSRYENELSKAGIYSFFAAFKSNELEYDKFYALLPAKDAYKIVRDALSNENVNYVNDGNSIKRTITSKAPSFKPNVIMITVESLSADFLGQFGNKNGLTPVLDSLAKENLTFTNMYATGTRTVRGMEALSLAIPPTPGNSIVRRQDNHDLTTVGNIFKNAGYSRTFYYGGDGYFDNMNEYFGGNGFDITDRGRNNKMNDTYSTKRTIITDDQVHFENAWGVSDEDLFDAVLRGADKDSKSGKPFYNFVMTTSNHRPYTFPTGRIKNAQGTRDAAVRYTDYAIGRFLKQLQQRPWYKNTVVIIVSDHCANSAGKNEIEISKYHIPCIIVNLPANGKQVIDKQCSQIDLYPTLYSLLGWNYESNLFGNDVTDKAFKSRVFLGTYQKLAYLENDSLVILAPQQEISTFLYDQTTGNQIKKELPKGIIQRAQSFYQTAYDLYKTGGLHQ